MRRHLPSLALLLLAFTAFGFGDHAIPDTRPETNDNGFGISLSGVIYARPWVTDWQSALKAIKAAGATHVSIPVDQGGDLGRLRDVLKAAHDLGLIIHIAPHFDNHGNDIQDWPHVDFAGYSAWFARVCQACTNGDGSTYIRSIELWNEAQPLGRAVSDWDGVISDLYRRAPTLVESIKHYLPGVQVIVPVPLDQSLEKSTDLLKFPALQSSIRRLDPDALSVHVYGTFLNQDDLDKRLKDAEALSRAMGLPIVVTEYGEGLRGSPVSAFYVAVAAWVRSKGSWGTAWQWDNGHNGDGLVLKDSPMILSAMATATYSPALGQLAR